MRRTYIPYILIAMVVVGILIVVPKWTVDDAYITFRYADNLVRHGELTYNAGQDPVEGYTGVLLPLCIALALRVGIAPESAAHLIGIVSFVLVLLIFFQLLSRLGVSYLVRIAFYWLLATAAFLYVQIFSGLETILFTALLLGSALQLHMLIQTDSPSLLRLWAIAISLLAISLCRPEGALYALIVVSILAGNAIFTRKSFRPVTIILILFFVPGALYFVWRWNYYGFLLPNTFYAKHSGSFSAVTLRSALAFAEQYLLLPLLATAAAGIPSTDETPQVVRENQKTYATLSNLLTLGSLILFAIIVMGVYLQSELMMNFSYRFYAPFYPVALLAFALDMSRSADALKSNSQARPYTYRAIAIGLSLLCAAQTALHFRYLYHREIPFTQGYKTRLSEMARPAGLYLRSRVPATEWLVVYIDAGAIPFYSRLNTVDFGNLNDVYLAHHHEKSSIRDRVDYFFSKNPGAVVFTTSEWDHVKKDAEAAAITSDPRFRYYALVKKFGNSTGMKYYYFVFMRKDLLRENEEIQTAQ